MNHNYLRIIPRDLFNESNILKCYGQLYLELEKHGKEDMLVEERDFTHSFNISQDELDGCTRMPDLILHDCYDMQYSDEEHPVFDQSNGKLSIEMQMMLGII
jgi:hypothetical protein